MDQLSFRALHLLAVRADRGIEAPIVIHWLDFIYVVVLLKASSFSLWRTV